MNTLEFGPGFDEWNLNNIRACYRAFPIWNTVRTDLSWTHYRILSRIEDGQLRHGRLAGKGSGRLGGEGTGGRLRQNA
jgi:hypothetical protein